MRHHVDDTPPQFVDYSYRTLQDLSADETGDAAFHQTKTGEIPAAHQARNVCKRCNEGWLSRLEHAARLVLSGLLQGVPKVLTPYDQFTVGTWIIKTCCMYDAALPHRLIPEAVGTRQLFTRGYPIQHSLAVIAHDPTIVPMGELIHAREPLRPPGFSDTTAVKFGFQFDHLVVFAIINLSDDGDEQFTISRTRGERIWPPREAFTWPSDEALVVPPPAPDVEPNEPP